MIPIGTHVQIVRPGSVFHGAIGVVVARPRDRRTSSRTNAVRFLDHPWQAKSPEASWFFDDDELERFSTTTTTTTDEGGIR